MQPAEILKVGMTYEEGYVPPRLVPFSQSWFVAKLVLRAMSCVLCIIIFGLAIPTSATTSDIYIGSDSAWIPSIPVAVAAVVYNVAGFFVLWLRRDKRRGIHPGLDVGADLLLWLAAGAAGILTPVIAYDKSDGLHDLSGFDTAILVLLFSLT
jgi:nitrate reductase gamma subunit